MLSVVIPTHNRPDLLAAAVRSALRAVPAGAEVVVVDDASTPPADPGPADPRLRVLRNAGDRGAGGARNFGVQAARGGLVLFLDDDDLLLPGYPARVLAAAGRGRSDWGFSATTVHLRGEEPAAVMGGGAAGVLRTGPFRRRLAGLGCGFWIRRRVFLELGGIATDLSVNEDTEFSLRLIASGRDPWFDPAQGVSLLRHGAGTPGNTGQATALATAEVRARCFRAILDRHGAWLAAHPDAERHLLRRLIKQEAKLGQGLGTALARGRWSGRPANLAYAVANRIAYGLRPPGRG